MYQATQLKNRIEELRPWRYNHQGDSFQTQSEFPYVAKMFKEQHEPVIREAISLFKGKSLGEMRALDLGCLEGHYTSILCDMGFKEVVGIDLSEEHIERATFLLQELKGYRNVRLVHGNVLDENLIKPLG